MYPDDETPEEHLPDDHDLEDIHDDTAPSNPIFKGCLIAIAIILILALLLRACL